MNCSIEGCENPCEGTLWICATHNQQRRRAEKDSKKVKIVKPVKKVSESRAKELTEYPKLKRQYLEHKMICEIRLEGCTKNATEIHHVSLSAKNFLNTNTWMGSCQSCHRAAENLSSEQRRSLGLLTD